MKNRIPAVARKTLAPLTATSSRPGLRRADSSKWRYARPLVACIAGAGRTSWRRAGAGSGQPGPAIASGRTAINLSWSAPCSNGGSDISGYRIEACSDSGSIWSDLDQAMRLDPDTTFAAGDE